VAKLGSVKLPLGEDMKYFGAIACLFAGMTPSAYAQEPGAVPVPQEVSALAGCWQGTGSVMGKPVSISLAAKPITEGALFLVEADSHAVTDPADRYAAHLIFGAESRLSSPTVSAVTSPLSEQARLTRAALKSPMSTQTPPS
jgi:hypothetical protein